MKDFEPISEDKLNKIFIEKKLNIDCKCRNENIYIDIQNKRIECAKCGAILDPFDVVYRLFYQEERYMERIKFLRQQCEELEKMYMRCKIKKQQTCSNSDTCYNGSLDECEGCNAYQYPPFTAEKQIAIIKLISQQGQVIIENWEKDNRGFNVTFRANSNLRYITMDCITRKTVEEALAKIVNDLWQDLTEEEKQQVKGILE